MKSYEHEEAVKALQGQTISDWVIQQDDGRWLMQLSNPNGETSLICLPDVERRKMCQVCGGYATPREGEDPRYDCKCKK